MITISTKCSLLFVRVYIYIYCSFDSAQETINNVLATQTVTGNDDEIHNYWKKLVVTLNELSNRKQLLVARNAGITHPFPFPFPSRSPSPSPSPSLSPSPSPSSRPPAIKRPFSNNNISGDCLCGRRPPTHRVVDCICWRAELTQKEAALFQEEHPSDHCIHETCQ